MTYRYLDHTADAGIEATGATPEEAFAEAARAMIGLMVRGGDAPGGGEVGIEAAAPSLEELLVEFLNELLAQQGLRGLVFTGCRVREIARTADGWRLSAAARGASPAALDGRLGQEVKAASYLGLSVGEREGAWTVRCVVDL
ncbi:MAG: archease [bacterium]|nr:archease [bacterium]